MIISVSSTSKFVIKMKHRVEITTNHPQIPFIWHNSTQGSPQLFTLCDTRTTMDGHGEPRERMNLEMNMDKLSILNNKINNHIIIKPQNPKNPQKNQHYPPKYYNKIQVFQWLY